MAGPAPLVLSGPSGAGKSTILKTILDKYRKHFGFSVSHTTRNPREGEVDGVAYHFVTKEHMQSAIDRGEFIEHACFAGNLYGTSKTAVESVRSKGLICVLDIDRQGVISIKKTELKPNYVFIKPPTIEKLEERLRARGTETDESLQRRLDAAREDMSYGETPGNFDLVLVNDDLKIACKKLEEFLQSRYQEIKE